mmetsp:Transcript_40925/g.104685  ORF Transcript_40925/g.104685 Transcript_40925/m.104685 type:complete len:422 (-) Transcript_40925:192-1457(-)
MSAPCLSRISEHSRSPLQAAVSRSSEAKLSTAASAATGSTAASMGASPASTAQEAIATGSKRASIPFLSTRPWNVAPFILVEVAMPYASVCPDSSRKLATSATVQLSLGSSPWRWRTSDSASAAAAGRAARRARSTESAVSPSGSSPSITSGSERSTARATARCPPASAHCSVLGAPISTSSMLGDSPAGRPGQDARWSPVTPSSAKAADHSTRLRRYSSAAASRPPQLASGSLARCAAAMLSITRREVPHARLHMLRSTSDCCSLCSSSSKSPAVVGIILSEADKMLQWLCCSAHASSTAFLRASAATLRNRAASRGSLPPSAPVAASSVPTTLTASDANALPRIQSSLNGSARCGSSLPRSQLSTSISVHSGSGVAARRASTRCPSTAAAAVRLCSCATRKGLGPPEVPWPQAGCATSQ